jgi:hypothetical protein
MQKLSRLFLGLFLTLSLNSGAFAQVVNPPPAGGSAVTATQGPGSSSNPWYMDVYQWNGVSLGSPSAYGTAPTGNVPGANVFVTNVPAVTQSAGPWSTNQTQLNSVALGSPSAYGTAPTGNVPGANVFVTNIPGVTQSGGPWTFNQTQLNSVALGSPTTYGTAPTGNVPGANVFVTNTPSVNMTQKGGTAIVADPCETAAWTQVNVNLAAAGASQVIAASSGKKLYICSGTLLAGAADNVAVVEGTGTNCATGQTAVFGGTSTAAGLNLGANQGAVWNGTGHHHFQTNVASDALCLNPSATAQLTGYLNYVAQ